MIRISAVIITYNEERNIERCLSSVQDVVDEIIVVDSFSTDRTKEICKEYQVQFHQHEFEGHIQQKNYALSLATNPIVLALDADECLSSLLFESIQQLKKDWKRDGYLVNRLNNYCGQWIRHGAWYPDRKLRLFDKRKAKWGGINPHDKIEMVPGSKIGILTGDLEHYTVYTLEDHDNQIEKFSTIRAKELFRRGKKATFYHLSMKPCIKFFKDYVLKLGFLDGHNGYLIAKKSAYAYYLRYHKLKSLQTRVD